MSQRFIIGVDLGQLQDYTAIAIVERVRPEGVTRRPAHLSILDGPLAIAEHSAESERLARLDEYHVVHLERAPLGTPYPAVVDRLGDLIADMPDQSITQLVLDGTGVGRPVVDLVRERLADRFDKSQSEVVESVTEIVFTGGIDVTREWGRYLVPKRDLIGTLDVLLQSGRLKIAQELPLAPALTEELGNVKRQVTPAGRDSYVPWREGVHDDLAYGLAVAVWWAEHTGGPEEGGSSSIASAIMDMLV